VRFHDLRHTAATLSLAQGVDPRTIMETLGHSQISLNDEHVQPAPSGRGSPQRPNAVPNGVNCGGSSKPCACAGARFGPRSASRSRSPFAAVARCRQAAEGPPTRLSPAQLEAWFSNHQQDGASPRAIRYARSVFRASLNQARNGTSSRRTWPP
jgi:hypothetical protein